MRTELIFLACAGLLATSPAFAADPSRRCAIPGEVVQWIADVCMARIGTDDEIAASDCIAKEIPRTPKGACAAKRHYKHALCTIAVTNGVFRGAVENCVRDPAFSGVTVRKGGVGG